MLNKILNYIDFIGYKEADHAARKTLWGVILTKIGTSLISIQATVMIYYFSYFSIVPNYHP